MPRREYQRSLDALQSDVREMGELVVDRLDRSLDALERKDADAAEAVIEGDDEINDLYLDLEAACVDLFALQQPVASDLRFVAASFKILTDLERVGDLATNFGRYTLVADRQRLPEDDVYDIGTDVRDLFSDAIDAYAAEDAAACREIAERDDDIDALCHTAGDRVVRGLIEQQAGAADAWSTERLLDDVSRLLLTIRDLERVADHAVNIAARTLYMTDNDPELIY
ncbi:MAG: phosphate signaling complex protein PhoU [Halovenus sp.]